MNMILCIAGGGTHLDIKTVQGSFSGTLANIFEFICRSSLGAIFEIGSQIADGDALNMS